MHVASYTYICGHINKVHLSLSQGSKTETKIVMLCFKTIYNTSETLAFTCKNSVSKQAVLEFK